MRTPVIAALAAAASFGCSSTSNTVTSDAGSACQAPPIPASNDYCRACTRAASANPAACTPRRPVEACCAWVQAPQTELARGTNLVRSSSTDPTIDLGCLGGAGALGTPKAVTLKGFVRLFSSGGDSAGVKIELFKEGGNGTLGEPVGQPYVTSTADPPQTPLVTYLDKCPKGGTEEGCKFRSFTYPNVPTETPLIIKTSDAAAAGSWAELYDYNIVFRNAQVGPGDQVTYDPAAVAATDVNTVASAAGGFTVKQNMGVLAGEVHDCGDVRLSGAMVDTDLLHEGPMFYFTERESDPLPDPQRAPRGLGTSKLGLFGALNLPTGQPLRVSAVGKRDGQTVLVGTYTVQIFPGAVTALSLRGRRPWQ